MKMIRFVMVIHILGIWLAAQTVQEIRISNVPLNAVQMAGFTLRSEKKF